MVSSCEVNFWLSQNFKFKITKSLQIISELKDILNLSFENTFYDFENRCSILNESPTKKTLSEIGKFWKNHFGKGKYDLNTQLGCGWLIRDLGSSHSPILFQIIRENFHKFKNLNKKLTDFYGKEIILLQKPGLINNCTHHSPKECCRCKKCPFYHFSFLCYAFGFVIVGKLSFRFFLL